MEKVLGRIKHEFLQVLPPTIFFLFAFSLLWLTKHLVLQEYGVSFADFANVVVGALLVGKVVLVADHLPFVDRYPEKPLIYNVVWKTVIYMIAATLVRVGEAVVSELLNGASLAAAFNHLVDGLVWPHFILIHVWLGLLLFFYCAFREYIRVIGKDQFLQVVFGVPQR